jgi:hypothetical protein
MKGLIRYGLAAAMVLATAMPAMAKVIDVCVAATDINEDSSKTFFTAASPFFPAGTIADGVMDCPAPAAGSIGTFYTAGGFLNPSADTNGNGAFVTWNFIFDKGGNFVTVGPVNLAADYKQTIVGGRGGLPNSGKIEVHNISVTGTGTAAFAFSVTFP